MKMKSVVDGVSFERWNTPLTGNARVWLSSMYESKIQTHFIFTTGYGTKLKKDERIYVLTIPRASSYRLIEEEYAYTCIGKYFRDDPNRPKRRKPARRYQTTWKISGASFTEELDEGKELSRKREKMRFEYLILTEDEWIGIVSDSVEWTELNNMTVQSAVRTFLK